MQVSDPVSDTYTRHGDRWLAIMGPPVQVKLSFASQKAVKEHFEQFFYACSNCFNPLTAERGEVAVITQIMITKQLVTITEQTSAELATNPPYHTTNVQAKSESSRDWSVADLTLLVDDLPWARPLFTSSNTIERD